MLRALQVACLLVFLSTSVYSQSNQEQPTVTFTLDFPGSQPGHYSVQVQSDGKAHYESSGKPFPESDEGDSFDYEFTISTAAREKIFGLSAKADFFQKDLDSHRKNMAFTGKKTLVYKDTERSGESTYNYSPDLAVQELTSLFQGLSATLEFGHRLEYALRYQKLALADELKRMEESARLAPPVEIQAITPILQQIIADPGVINVTRARAQRLLERSGGR
ncbi:MAG: hypothetical protein WAQ52_09130 [Terriglobales bacterium]